MRREIFGAGCFLLTLAIGCGSGSGGLDGGLYVGGHLVEDGTAFIDGDYHWTVLAPPREGDAVYAIAAVGPNDIWFAGHSLRHWDGQKLTDFMAPPGSTEGTAGIPYFESAPYLDDLRVVSSTDIWAAGNRLLHWDGMAWTDKTIPLEAGVQVTEVQVAASSAKVFVEENVGRYFTIEDGMAKAIQMGGALDPPSCDPSESIRQCPGEMACQASGKCDYPGDLSGDHIIPHAVAHPLLLTSDGTIAFVGAGVLSQQTMACDSSTPCPYPDFCPMPTDGSAPVCHQVGPYCADGHTCPAGYTCDVASHYCSGAVDQPSGLAYTLDDPKSALLGTVAQHGMTLYGWDSLVTNDAVAALVTATVPGNFQEVATLPKADFQGYTIEGVTTTADGAIYIANGTDKGANQTAALVRLSGSSASLLKDRLYGWVPYSVGATGNMVFVGSDSGAILMGVKK